MPLSKIQLSSTTGRRNLVINGDMQVAQRSSSAVQAGNGTYNTVDRMMTWSGGSGTFTGSQSTGHQLATGHDTAFKVDVTGADTSIAAGDYYEFLQRIEAKNLQHLRWGTAAAQKLQVSFWVRATKTGVQSLFVSKQGTGTDYRNVFNYTINASDTWEHKIIEVPALTASTIANDASTYVQVGWILAMGSDFQNGTAGTWTTNSFFTTSNTVNHMDSTSNDFYVTGFQVEVGDTATEFEYRSFDEELFSCQRYFQLISGGCFPAASASTLEGSVTRREMRVAPTIGATAVLKAEDPSVTVYTQSSAVVTTVNADKFAEKMQLKNFSGLSTQRPYFLRNPDAGSGQVTLEAEL